MEKGFKYPAKLSKDNVWYVTTILLFGNHLPYVDATTMTGNYYDVPIIRNTNQCPYNSIK